MPDIHAAVSDASYMYNYREAKGKLVWLEHMSKIKMYEVIDIVSSLTPTDYSFTRLRSSASLGIRYA